MHFDVKRSNIHWRYPRCSRERVLTARKDSAKSWLILIFILFCLLMTANSVRSSVGRALILSPVEDSHQFSKLEDLMNDLTSIGYSVDVLNSSQVTVEFLESTLINYSIIIFRTESIEFEREALSFLTGEIVSEETINKYQQEISDELVAHTSSKVFRIFPKFIEHFYAPNGLRGKLIYFFSAFSSSFSSSFMKAGATVFIGYSGDVYLEWGIGDRATTSLFDFLCRGYDVDQSVRETNSCLIAGGAFLPHSIPYRMWERESSQLPQLHRQLPAKPRPLQPSRIPLHH